MSEYAEYIDTVVRLMRLTREGLIHWEVVPTERHAPLLRAEVEGLSIALEDVWGSGERSLYDALTEGSDLSAWETIAGPAYRFKIEDLASPDEPAVISPPLQAVNDLAAVIRGQQAPGLKRINERLDLALGESR